MWKSKDILNKHVSFRKIPRSCHTRVARLVEFLIQDNRRKDGENSKRGSAQEDFSGMKYQAALEISKSYKNRDGECEATEP